MTDSIFTLIRKERIPALNITVEEYRHETTGARHYHLAADDNNNAFLVAFLTVPQDGTGVAHVLEHTSLCGSERFPVRDPFFMMIRRSLNTFMNAFTSSDWTAYPFATQNRTDYDNLLQVYLDAAFFPRLDALDFAQEGHRVEFSNPNDPNTELVYKGVVFNEMKGAMSSPVRQLAQDFQSNLFPTTTYHYNSGGDPEEIPNLRYEDLKNFHARHYHPSNAVFMTYGNFPVTEHQAKIHDLALERFERQDMDLTISDEQRYTAPIRVETTYPLEGDESSTGKTHIVLGWLLGRSTDLWEMMNAQLLAGVLLDNSASPLRLALETTALGTAPSELCGFDDSTKEAIFACGVEGSEPDKTAAVEELILGVLEDVARNGIPRDEVESVLHQLELSQREVGGGRFPYGLQLMVRALPAALHGGDPVATLDIDPVLEKLREKIQSPSYIKDLARRLLLDNRHRISLTMAPDFHLGERRAETERQRLAAMKAAMSEAQDTEVVKQAAALKLRQETEDDPGVLPKVGLEDVPAELNIPAGHANAVDGMPGTWYAQGTNGLVYEQIVVNMPHLEPELVDDLPLFCGCVTELGCGDLDYLQTQAWQASVSGGISARASLRASISDVQTTRGLFVLAGKALARNQEALAELLGATFARARFDELPRLRELVAQIRAHQEAGVTDQGHVLALVAASAGMGPCGALAHRWDGLRGLQRLKKLDETLEDEEQLAAFASRLARIREAIQASPRQTLVVSEQSQHEVIRSSLTKKWGSFAKCEASSNGFLAEPTDFSVHQAWSTNTQVNFCAKAYSTVAQDHSDAPALTVLGPFLRNGFLHRAIREQGGAYGAGANYAPDTGAFRFFSYRDPRMAETLTAFDSSVEWLKSERHEPRALEEAVLGVISDIDRPESPAGEAIVAFFGDLHGRTPEQRRRFRQAILNVSLSDLKRVADEYLRPASASIAVVSNAHTLEQNSELGLETHKL